ncbi:cysteine hydrolase [Amycolatopsis acidicola]|uniref:Cysteine hydrolase n=1 Tax=Amycolatopsis acidicola TaxID=2596893 RepID=A0A5N0VCF2_9PSEU|nr:isochorismatase family cysteine hydrolase [Amycolatopsis acidicola]KAA9162561.1 cysteine hydrolase [Amycolatopsis acidicola]
MTVDEANISAEVLPGDVTGRWFNSAAFDVNDPWKGLNPARAAFVLVDLINWQAHPDGTSLQLLRKGGSVPQADFVTKRCETVLLPTLKSLLPVARSCGMHVLHARLISRAPDYRDAVPAFQGYLRAAEARDGSWAGQVLDGLEAPGDISVAKRGSGAFTGSELDTILRNLDIDTVFYAGVVTNACVLLSVASGFDLGYRQYLVTDCTAALSERDQEDAERFIGAYLAQLVTAEDTTAALKRVAAS